MEINLEKYKEEFIALLKECNRDGMDDVIADLEENGFFEAPASAGHHLNVKGGLVLHSLNTCKAALAVWEGMQKVEPTCTIRYRAKVLSLPACFTMCASKICMCRR